MLMQIQPFIQAYVLALSSILEATVTVVDSELVRVGGSDDYACQLDEKINHAAFFKRVLESGKPDFIRDVRRERGCSACPRQDSCKELADLAYPILLDGQALGVIGVIAFSEDERGKLLRDRDKIFEFMKYMCMLIESKLLTLRQTQALEGQVSEVISREKKRLDEMTFLGRSPAVRAVLDLVRKIGASDSTVLLGGESGTGKEVMARYLHNISPRGNRLLTSVNCGAIPESLVESELFGYEEGAFTGAKKGGQMGKFELAHQSTLFLDEIGEMPLAVQPKLLRVLQERTVQRLGGKKALPVDVRIICAGNRDLREQVAEGSFRKDLFYRLNVIPIVLPPLRERREDIPLFVERFVAVYNHKLHKRITGLSPEALEAFLAYDWPGNVRELRNLIEYLANVVEGGEIRLRDLPEHLLGRGPAPEPRGLKGMLKEHEKNLLRQFVSGAPGGADKLALAKSLGISTATLYRKLAEYDLL